MILFWPVTAAELRAASHPSEYAAFDALARIPADESIWTRNRKHYPMREITFFD